MDRSAKLRKLDDTRRKLPFASVSACSAWISEIKKKIQAYWKFQHDESISRKDAMIWY